MRIFITFVCLILLTRFGAAAEFRSFTAKDGRVLVSIVGELVDGDTDRFKSAIKTANDAGKFVANVRLNSVGGNLLEGVKLAQAVQFAKIATNVGKNGVCASACFLVFAAGQTKYANYSAQIGVHGASTRAGEEAGDATVSMARVAKELGVPAAIIGRMVVTPPTEMVWLSPQDLQSMGTTMVGKPSQVSNNLSQDTTAPAPGKPMQLDGSSTATRANVKDNWTTMVENVISLSARQNGGRPRTIRSCQPAQKVCTTGVLFKTKKGQEVMLVRREDINGATVERELCTFNSFGDSRSCVNLDTDVTHRDMKDANGEWTKVAD